MTNKAVGVKATETKEPAPKAKPINVHRWSGEGNGLQKFSHITALSVEQVVEPGYFNAMRDAFERFDQIDLVADSESSRVQVCKLIVTSSRPADDVTVEVLGGVKTVEMPAKRWFEILGIHPKAKFNEIEAAYKSKAREHHPDRGGSTKAFQEIQEAFHVAKSFHTE